MNPWVIIMTRKHAIKFIPLLFALFIQSCASTTQVTPVASVIRSGRGGIVYALPETVLDIVVPIDRTTETPPEAPFAEYSERLFGQKPKITADKVTYMVGLPTVTASGEPDQSKVFYAQISGGPFSDSSMTMKFDARGVLTSSTVESENKTLEFVVSTFEAGAKIGGSAAKFISATNAKACDDIPPAVCDAYTRIKDSIQNRSNILTGPGGDIATRLAEINEAIKKDMALFFGSKAKDTWSAQFHVVPRGLTAANISLFSYSPSDGIVEFHISPRNQINKDFFHPRSGQSKPVYINISGIQPLVENAIASGRLFTQPKRGLHYNIPAVATVRVYDGTTKLLTSNQTFAQFGSIGFLPVSTGSHKLHQEVTLDGATGALLAVTNSSNAFDPNNINKIGNATSSFMDASDPKTKAERERDIAKARYEKLDLEKKTRDLEASMKPTASTGDPGTP
jgi:hypothetical protein